jgi:ribosomal protein L12E/L44/L45/RPP1/RPP2
MKRFLNIQTKLHDSICAKRQAATIATHDLESVNGPLTYDARAPASMYLVPLNKRKEITAAQLVARLRQEAEAQRKESKRNTVSGIHKYLELLKGKSMYPCLVDANNLIISFPPITNCNATKVLSTTRHVFVEVTSSTSLDVCKKVMDELLQHLLDLNIGQLDEPPKVVLNLEPVNPGGATGQSTENAASGDQAEKAEDEDEKKEEEEDDDEEEELAKKASSGESVLVVEQVRVVDDMGGLRIVYPSRVDLKSDAYLVLRDYE